MLVLQLILSSYSKIQLFVVFFSDKDLKMFIVLGITSLMDQKEKKIEKNCHSILVVFFLTDWFKELPHICNYMEGVVQSYNLIAVNVVFSAAGQTARILACKTAIPYVLEWETPETGVVMTVPLEELQLQGVLSFTSKMKISSLFQGVC